MRRFLAIAGLFVVLAGCNMNENKEARIRQLETQSEQATTKLEQLENRVQALESKLTADED